MAEKKVGKDRKQMAKARLNGMDDYPMPLASPPKALKADQCRWRVDPKKLGFKSTMEVKPLRKIVGQPRALQALKLGTELHAKGYNIYVSGLSATGRSTAVKAILEGFRLKSVQAQDRCYVNNFKIPDQPRLLSLPRGQGRKISHEMDRLMDNLRNTIPHALDDETVLSRKRDLTERYARQEAALFQELEANVAKDGFALVQVQMGPYTRPDIFPIIDGKPTPPNQVGKMVEEGKFHKKDIDKLYKKYQGYKSDLRSILKQVRQLSRDLSEKTAEIERDVLREIIADICTDFAERFPHESVKEYICEVQDFIIENPGIFGTDSEDAQPAVPLPHPIQMPADDLRATDPFRLFQVNVIRDGAAEDSCPVIIEHNPSFLNLFGNIDREWRMGGYWSTDFTMIKGGSLLRADGGYLVLNALDVLQEPLAWRTLVRTLKTCRHQIQAPEALMSIAPSSLKPEPIELEVTVILIGDSWVYHLLYAYEQDFSRIFKVRADFDTLMPRGKAQIGHYAALASKMAEENGLLHLNAAGVARLAEEGARLAGRGNKMSARLGEVADILREASHHAQSGGSKLVDAKHVEQAIKGREYRQDLIRERIDEAIDEGILMIDTRKEVVGQVNGLAVHDLGEFAFGRPTRLTCEVSMGDGGVVNIEREAKLSGKIHDKGVLILEGYIRHMYGQDGPISFSASIAFEQSYSQIDGDSATLAEVLALTSQLSNLSIRQDLAVTGSVNQKGQVQAIGGVNEKIEGFFRVCKSAGLTGTQGVVIPSTNVKELMLSSEVIDAVKAGKFSVIPVSTVNQALEIFTGVKAGRRLKKGGFTKGSVHDRVDITLAHFYWASKRDDGKSDDDDSCTCHDGGRRRGKKDDDCCSERR